MNSQGHAQSWRVGWPLITQLHSNWNENSLNEISETVINNRVLQINVPTIYKPKEQSKHA